MVKLLQNTGNQRYQVLHPVADCLSHEHGNGQFGNVLLELKVPVHRQEHIKLGGGES